MNKPTKNPPHALPAPSTAEAPTKDPSAKPELTEKKPSWLVASGKALGAFIAGIAAGVTAGYVFGKAEEKFSSYGENILVQLMKTFTKERGYAGRRPPWREGSSDFHDRSPRRPHGPEHDPMGDDSGSTVQEDDRV